MSTWQEEGLDRMEAASPLCPYCGHKTLSFNPICERCRSLIQWLDTFIGRDVGITYVEGRIRSQRAKWEAEKRQKEEEAARQRKRLRGRIDFLPPDAVEEIRQILDKYEHE